MKTLPTDRNIFQYIFKTYNKTFSDFSEENKTRSSKIYVPIDIKKIASEFDIDPDIIFGRLYYHLDQKYGYKTDDGSHVHLFTMRIGQDHHCINFPYMVSILSGLESENKKFIIATAVSVVALLISIIALVFNW